jgi:hypothetical protein
MKARIIKHVMLIAMLLSSAVPVFALSNTGFETPDEGASGWEKPPSGAVWTFTGGGGVGGPNSPWKCNSTSPDPLGDQFAFLQNSATITQTLSGLTVGGNYIIYFYESYRIGTSNSNDLAVILDEGLVSTSTVYYNSAVTDNTWQSRQSSEFMAEKDSYTLTFSTTNPLDLGDTSTIIDGVSANLISGSVAGNIIWSPGTNPITSFSSANISVSCSTNTTGTLLLWDTSDKGTSSISSWSFSSNLGVQAGGNITELISSLQYNTTYTFRMYGVNDTAIGWSSAYSFTTPDVIAFSNRGFETPDQGISGYEVSPSSASWTFSSAGVAGPNSPFKCSNTSSDALGDQFAWLQGTATVTQTLSDLTVGGNYIIYFYESYRIGTSNSNDLSLILDEGIFSANTIYNNAAVTDNTWQTRQSSEFIAEKEWYNLTFRTTNPLGGDRSTIIDGVSANLVYLPGANAILWTGAGNTAISTSSANIFATLSTNTTGSLLLWDTSDKGKGSISNWSSSSNLGVLAAGNMTGEITALQADTAYAFRLYGINDAGIGWSAAYSFSTNLTAAQTPVFTSANVVTSTVTLTWTDNAINESAYILSRSDSGSGGPYNTIATLAANTITYADVAPYRQTSYYRLTAYNSSNASETDASSCQTSASVVLAPVLRLQAKNYNASTGAWTDSSGLNNHGSQGTPSARPSLESVQSPKSISAVRFDGNDYLTLTNGISTVSDADGFTAFVVLRPDGDGTILGGTSGCYQYRISTGLQNSVRQQQSALGSSNTAPPVGSSNIFSSINAKVNNSGGTYRLNGSDDGTFTGSSFTNSISYIGNRSSNAEWFTGDIAEIRLYETQLTAVEIAAIEKELRGLYLIVARGTIFMFD